MKRIFLLFCSLCVVVGSMATTDIFFRFVDQEAKESLLKQDTIRINGEAYKVIPSFPRSKNPKRALYYDLIVPDSVADVLIPSIKEMEGVKFEGRFGEAYHCTEQAINTTRVRDKFLE